MKWRAFKRLKTPVGEKELGTLRAGDWVLLSGRIYTARDQAHQRIAEAVLKGKRLPVSFKGQAIYYCGPTPAKPGAVIGSAGPTTSSRMDKYLETVLELGVVVTIGKGERSKSAKELFKKYHAVYLVSVGGAGAYLSERVKNAEVVLWQELGPEAIYKLYVEDFPCLVAYDILGNDYFERRRYCARKAR